MFGTLWQPVQCSASTSFFADSMDSSSFFNSPAGAAPVCDARNAAIASASACAVGPCSSFGIVELGRWAFGSRIQFAIQEKCRREPMPSKLGASIVSSGAPTSVVWHFAQRASKNSSRPSRSLFCCTSDSLPTARLTMPAWTGSQSDPFSDHSRRNIASPLAGLVKVTFSALLPLPRRTGLVGSLAFSRRR